MTETLSIAEVDTEIAEATSAVADLEQKVVDGDTKITADAIAKARSKIEFLGLRRRAAERTEAERAEVEHQAAVAELSRDVAAFAADGLDDLIAAHEDFRQLLAEQAAQQEQVVGRDGLSMDRSAEGKAAANALAQRQYRETQAAAKAYSAAQATREQARLALINRATALGFEIARGHEELFDADLRRVDLISRDILHQLRS